MRIYLDNAASTPLDPKVLESMLPYMTDQFGNPSSIHSEGRKMRSAIEKSRKKVADVLHVSPAEIFFTSGGTESDNTAIISGILSTGIKHAITSAIEHHAVLHSLQYLEKSGIIELSYVHLDEKGKVDLLHLEELLRTKPRSFVSLMHANNEIGNITDISLVAQLCKEYSALFHSDTVQTVAHLPLNLQNTAVHFITGSAHKFHGPKGIGFLYINGDHHISPFIHGGAQERNMRGGTENVAGIIGLADALEIAASEIEHTKSKIQGLKSKMIQLLQQKIEGVEFNGDTLNSDQNLFTVLNFSVPESDDNEMLLFNLDINGVSASGGSACTSGSVIGSHVLNALNVNPRRGHLRFSFSKLNTEQDIEEAVNKLQKILADR